MNARLAAQERLKSRHCLRPFVVPIKRTPTFPPQMQQVRTELCDQTGHR
jgi:hypothetical protein